MHISDIFLKIFGNYLNAIIFTFIFSLLVIIMSIWSMFKHKRPKKQEQEIEQKLLKSNAEIVSSIDSILPEKHTKQDIGQRLINLALTDPSSSIHYYRSLESEEISKEIDRKTSVLLSKIKEINERFPPNAVLEKYASINDALLVQSIENLDKRLKNLEEKLLTKNDVIIIVLGCFFTMIAVFCGVITILNYIK